MDGDGFHWEEYRAALTTTVTEGVRQAADGNDVGRVMAAAAATAEETLRERREREGRSVIACGPGCSVCCAVYVSVLIPEAIAIALHLREGGGPEVPAIAARLDEESRRLRWVSAEERLRLGVPCVFLADDGRCAIYPVRPLTCRSVTSTDPEMCRRAMNVTSLDDDEEEGVIMDLFQRLLFDETFRAVADALDGLGLDSRSRELTAGVKGVFDDPTLAAVFLRGERLRSEQ